jgi:mono/diheme cytochrome c family protein
VSLAARGSIAVCVLVLAACGSADEEGPTRPWERGKPLPHVEQEEGDAALGEHTLLHGNYMSCGIPYALWTDPNLGPSLQGSFGGGGEPLPGREGKNADMPYSLNVFTAVDGAEVVNANCLTCHAGRFDGELVIGLGSATADFTSGIGGGSLGGVSPDLVDLLPLTDVEKDHARRMLRLGKVVGPETVMRTVGNNPAEALTAVLVAHRDPVTLAWSDEPLVELVVKDESGAAIPDAILTSDPPPWWRAKKKNALFYNGMARGQHRGTMALATSVCVDDVTEATRVDGLFRDIHAFVASIVAPKYPRAIDAALAADGKTVFERDCAGCHGTYADDPAADHLDTYPNLLIPLDVIGTDPAVANAGVVHAPELVDWYNGSFYGTVTPIVPDDPFPGYVAPPLDGIWATAPYLHNGSVPTVELVLDSGARPDAWKRVDYDSTHFDEDALGWPFELVPGGQADLPSSEAKHVYDTRFFSQDRLGHTFGDHLTSAERRAVIEYLKTL